MPSYFIIGLLETIIHGEGVSWDGYKGHVQTLADTGILVNK